MTDMARRFRDSASPADYARAYAARLSEALAGLDLAAVARCVETVDRASRAGRTLYVAANGGSAAAGSHLVNDLVAGAYAPDQPGFRAVCLADNLATVTALANDAGYENVFVDQLRTFLDPDDVLLCLSVSGNSENLVRAAKYAREHGAAVLAWCGMDGGRLAGLADVTVQVSSARDEYGPVEDVFGALGHMVATYLAQARGRSLAH